MTWEQPNRPHGPTGVPWNPPAPGSSWDPSTALAPTGTGTEPQPDGLPLVIEPSAPSRRRRAIAIGGAAALVAAGTFAVTSLAAREDGGGATPEEAVEKLITALDEEDVLGAMDVLLPGERRTFRQPMTDMVEELSRLGVLGEEASLGGVGGADLEIEVDDVDLDEVADDIVNVELEGEASIEIDAEALPIGDLVVDGLLGGEEPSGRVDEETSFGTRDSAPLRFTTVREDGRWYVSLWYSVAESVREASGLDVPDADEAVEPDGGDSPEDAADKLLTAISDLDLEGVVAVLNPDEFGALQRYAPLFLDDAQAALDDASSGVDIELSDVEFDVEARGDDRAAVGMTSFRISVVSAADEAVAEWDSECMRVEVDGENYEGCAGDGIDFGELGDLGGISEVDMVPMVLGGVATVLADSHPLQMVRVDGKWFLSVFGSILDAMVEGLRGLDEGDLEEGLDALTDLIEGGVPFDDEVLSGD